MRTRVVLSVLGFSLVLAAQSTSRLTINPATPWGAALQDIVSEVEESKKLERIDEFFASFAADPRRRDALLWLLPQKQNILVKRQQHVLVMEAAEKFLVLDPNNETGDALPLMVNALKAAEARKDVPAVRSWSLRTSTLARAAMGQKTPEESDAAARERQDYVRQVDIYTEYAIANAALQYASEVQAPELLTLLEKQNARSAYLPQACQGAFGALKKQNQLEAAATTAERCFERKAASEEMLIVAADFYLRKNTAPDRVIRFSEGAVALLAQRPKPEGTGETAWKQRRDLLLGLAHWMAGVTYSAQNQFASADEQLRFALPLVESNPELLAPALFHLGLANFRLGEKTKDRARLTDAARFSQRCAAIRSPLQAQAAKNLQVIQQQFGIR